ncbi:MAG: rRNA maturation RNase YbeY, partial [Leptolyngbya sp. SIO3F4]|nr:rRNA maturation RNase YbeY [Leptolyngbya sp. SIO3F4]
MNVSNSLPVVELWVEASQSLNEVQLHLPNSITWQRWFSTWLTILRPTLSPINQYEVSLLLTDDSTIQSLNATYRHQDKATDVLAFAAQEAEITGDHRIIYKTAPLPLGDIVISVETAQRQLQ